MEEEQSIKNTGRDTALNRQACADNTCVPAPHLYLWGAGYETAR